MRQWLEDQLAARTGTSRIGTRSATALSSFEEGYEEIVDLIEEAHQFIQDQAQAQPGAAQIAPEPEQLPQPEEAPAAAAMQQIDVQAPAAEQEVMLSSSQSPF